jgi:hypothetical protein
MPHTPASHGLRTIHLKIEVLAHADGKHCNNPVNGYCCSFLNEAEDECSLFATLVEKEKVSNPDMISEFIFSRCHTCKAHQL